jgi:hypothetical protein
VRLPRLLLVVLPLLVAACASIVGFPDVPDIAGDDASGTDSASGGDSPSSGSSSSGSSSSGADSSSSNGADSSSSSGDDSSSSSGADSSSSGGADSSSSSGADSSSGGTADSAPDGPADSGSSSGADAADAGKETVTLNVTKTGTGHGTVKGDQIDCGMTCTEMVTRSGSTDPMVTLTATPDATSVFKGWSGACSGTTAMCTVTLSQAQQTVNAQFDTQVASLTINARVFGPGSGSVTSSPPGISCTAPCMQSANFPLGNPVILTASGGALVWWAPGTKCTGSMCSVTPTGPTTVGVTFSGNNFVFTSSLVHDGNIGGVAGGDAMCSQAATAAGLPGAFISWLGTSTSNPLTRLGSARGWIRPDGLPFVDQASGLKNGQILYPPAVNEQGQPAPNFFVYTGANVDGTIVTNPQSNCSDFTSNASAALGNGGASTGGTWVWTSGLAQYCSGSYPVYCFGTDLSNPVTFTPATGRHAFLSKGLFSPSSNVPVADALCQSEAMSAGLANPTHFLAMLATTTTTAASRFNLSGANWVRPDGIPITSTPTDIERTLLAGISVHADGTYAANATLTGAYAPPPIAGGATSTTALGTAASTCSDYSTSAGNNLAIGWAGYTSSWFNFSESACSIPLSVFCFEN